MNMVINNPKSKYIYFNRQTNQLQYEIYDLITIDRLRNANLKSHENNVSNYYSRPDRYKEVIKGIIPIPPRSRWLYDGNSFFCFNNRIVSFEYHRDLFDLLKTSQRLASVFQNKKVGVELSGGLDTSLVIGILEYLGIHTYLIGMRSSRYELRTESFIQDKYAASFQNVKLINGEEALPFSNLSASPLHQLPSSSSLYYSQASKIAEECNNEGVEFLFSGMGFDALLCDYPISKSENEFPDSWFSWMLDDNWFNENVYDKFNITYKSAAASPLIIKTIWALRRKQSEDLKKWWARETFKDFLPSELVNYAYKGDNSGGFVDGFMNAKNDIANLFQVAYDITNFNEFNPANLHDLSQNVHLVDERKDKLILGRVSFANWIFGLLRDKIIA